MTPITPVVRLFTSQDNQDSGLHINSLILEYKGNNYHLHGGTRDTIHVFTQGIAIYVLSINTALGYIGFSSFMVPQPDAINSIYLHNNREIKETLGHMWESLSAKTIATRLIDYLI
jgi:hypothetical protein